MKILQFLSEKRDLLNGKTLTKQESQELAEVFNDKIPRWFMELLYDFPVIGCDFILSEEDDESGFGVEMRWMSSSQMISSATEFYPGIVAILFGYLPIGMCLQGSGDDYFIKFQDKDPPLVRIPHDSIYGDRKLREENIDIVSSTLSMFFQRCIIDE